MGSPAKPQLVGRYAIYGRIASGGMASVHFGRLLGAAGFARTVAIKRLHAHLLEEPEFTKTLIDEARLAARIHHPNVVPTLDVVATDDELLVVMEYVRGQSLSRLVRALAPDQRIPLPIASAIAVGALHGLHAAHEAKSDQGTLLSIVHRDVSPQNILVGVDGVSRVIDFGVAKAVGRLQTTREGVIKGKLSYMAPEQLASLEVTRQADVYAMAVVVWEILAGRRLFQAESEAALVARVMSGASDPPTAYAPHLPAGLDELVMKGLSTDATKRFTSAREMADALASLVAPALPTVVGDWVAGVAGESLAGQGALLAEIESSSGMAGAPPPAGFPTTGGATSSATPGAAPAESQREEVRSEQSQTSSLTVETPRPSRPPRARGRRLAVAAGTAAALTLVSAAAIWSRGRLVRTNSVSASGAPPPAVPTAIPSTEALPAVAARGPIEAPSATPSARPSATTSRTGGGPPAQARPASPVRPKTPPPAASPIDPASIR